MGRCGHDLGHCLLKGFVQPCRASWRLFYGELTISQTLDFSNLPITPSPRSNIVILAPISQLVSLVGS